ncbi:MAG: hypothetical protein ACFB6R_07745 [Alphaproteobacteria bacterium]
MTTKKFAFAACLAGISSVVIAACSQSEPGPDLTKVVERTETAMTEYQDYLTRNGIEEAGPDELQQFETVLVDSINSDPRFYGNPIGVDVAQDGSVDGFKDTNANNEQDYGENALFKIEIDSANQRMIVTDLTTGNATGFPFMGAATGFLAGALIGNLLSRQRSAGIQPSSFNNRSVQSPSQYANQRSAAQSQARSRARSGGPSRGK